MAIEIEELEDVVWVLNETQKMLQEIINREKPKSLIEPSEWVKRRE
jgi:hypothetical protein